MFEASATPEPGRAGRRSPTKILLAIVIVVPSLLALLRLLRAPEAEAPAAIPPREPERAEPEMARASAPVQAAAPVNADPLPTAHIPPNAPAASTVAQTIAVPSADNPPISPGQPADDPLISPELIEELLRLRDYLNSEDIQPHWRLGTRWILGALISVLPLLMLFGLPALLMPPEYTTANYLPIPSDDMYYWRQAVSFSTVGLESGYFSFEEQTARDGNYYAWGIFLPALQGTIARLFGGITPLSIPLMGAVMLGIALAVFLLALKPSVEQELWLLGGLAVFVPLWVLHITSLSEMTHFTMTVLIATVFYKLLTAPSRWWGIAGVIIVMAATLLRPTMSMFFVPLCLLMVRPLTLVKIVFAFAAALALAAGPVYAVLRTSSPYPFQDWLPILEALQVDAVQAVQLALMNAHENIVFLNLGIPPEVFQRVLFVVLFVLLLAIGRRNLHWRTLHLAPLPAPEILLHLFNLSVIALFYLLFYDMRDLRDFRGIAPHLLLSLVLFAAFRRRFWLALFVVSGALFLPQSQAVYTNWASVYLAPGQPARLAEWKEKLANALEYEPNAPSPWCNTVLHSTYYLTEFIPVLALPPEFGTSFIFGMNQVHDPFWSRYVMLRNEESNGYPERVKSLERMIDLPDGTLYFNPNSQCTTPKPPEQPEQASGQPPEQPP